MIKEIRHILPFTNNKSILSIDDYLRTGGFSALKEALQRTPEEVIEEIIRSGLRGRGGAGFPTGLKWKFTRQSPGEEKFVICNADEGEPGTFKDKAIMESNPLCFIEGLIIAAYATGASRGYIYIRGEYYKSIEAVESALKQCYTDRFLGLNIFNSRFSCDIEIKKGAGSYLCGEELTLIESLEGKRGHPRIKPPFPAEKGVFNKPTLVNNVETLANVPYILHHGADVFRESGTEKSPGTKIFAVSGDVIKPGLYETELGVPLKDILYGLAGGMKGTFKAALLGGAAGTFIDKSMINIRMDYDTLAETGLTLGSGAIIVMNDTRDIGKMLVSILEFFKHESCGKCVPCRVGCVQLMKMAGQLERSEQKSGILNKMAELSESMAKTSLCPLGQSPKLPVTTSIRYFKYEMGGDA